MTSTDRRARRTTRLVALCVASAVALVCAVPRPARGFGDRGAFDPRTLVAGGVTRPPRPTAAARWSWELIQRTSAPARLQPTTVRADASDLPTAPFAVWSGDVAAEPLTAGELSGMRRYFALGGVLLVDDAGVTDAGEPGPFGRSARRELSRVLPDSARISLGPEHVLFRSYYLLRRAEGRVLGPKNVEAIVRGGQAQVIFLSHDLGGALARGVTGAWEHPVVPNGDGQREHAVRLAVNIAMYVLCSNYKDDQVHAPFLMRRRALVGGSP
ncbi:MAG TPA: DUF4159 domain-containing protein [Polyangiaceae bacterium]|nr:DUF4159 domain-containing protein [Polyangiaceae bacterium]